MSLKCVTDKRWRNYLEFEQDLEHGFRKYAGKVALHEAGYDSYITGIAFASMVKQLEVQTFVEWTQIKAREASGLCNTTAHDFVVACRTGRDFQVPLTKGRNLVELTATAVSLSTAVEFCNYFIISMEGQRACRLEPEYWKMENITEHKNVIWIETSCQLTAQQLSEAICDLADMYVMKDSVNQYFVEIQWVDERKYPTCKTAKDFCNLIKQSDMLGKYVSEAVASGLIEQKVEYPILRHCMTFMEALYHRRSIEHLNQ